MNPTRLRALLSAGIAGEHVIFSIRTRIRASSYFREIREAEKIERPRRFLHCAVDEDNDFSELGPAMGASVLPKLMTEKPDPFKPKKISGTEALSKLFSPEKGTPRRKDVSLKMGNSSSIDGSKLENQKNTYNFRKTNSVTIRNVPSALSLLQLKEALSVFGNISDASMTTDQDKLDCLVVEFENVESRDKAIVAGGITVEKFDLTIKPFLGQEANYIRIRIRISNISSETTDSEVHSMCKLHGPLEGLVRTNTDSVDAVFSVEDDSDIENILRRLNYTLLNGNMWSARLRLDEHEDDTSSKLETEIGRHLEDINTQITMKKVLMDDLDNLQEALMHLEAHPVKNSEVSSTE